MKNQTVIKVSKVGIVVFTVLAFGSVIMHTPAGVTINLCAVFAWGMMIVIHKD